jgi:hypothetical protein
VIRSGLFREVLVEEPTLEGESDLSAAHVTESFLEIELVEQWRLDSLERAGYDAESAAVLAASPEVDLHVAVMLLKRGCPVELALQILL